jgi:hypothetical protein
MRERDQAALLFNGLYRTVAPKSSNSQRTPRRPIYLAVACSGLYFPCRLPRRVCDGWLAPKYGCRQSLGVRPSPEARSVRFSIEPRYKSVYSLGFVNKTGPGDTHSPHGSPAIKPGPKDAVPSGRSVHPHIHPDLFYRKRAWHGYGRDGLSGVGLGWARRRGSRLLGGCLGRGAPERIELEEVERPVLMHRVYDLLRRSRRRGIKGRILSVGTRAHPN